MVDKNCSQTSSLLKYNLEKPFLALNYESEFSKWDKINYTKGCKWAPDGSCLLTANDNKSFFLFNLPSAVSTGQFLNEEWLCSGWKEDTKPALVLKEKEDIYDYCWFPNMNSADAQSSCFISSCIDLPIHLWDAWSGDLRASYLAYDHLDQMVAAYAVGFTCDGYHIIGGYNKEIRVFDTNVPGRKNITIKCDEQVGKLSSVACHPQLPKLCASSSYNGAIGLFSLNTKKCFAVLKGHSKGITQLKFSDDGTMLFSGTRKDDEILCWDMRNPGTMLSALKRNKTSNQRIYFDLTQNDSEYLLSGSSEGDILVYNLKDNLPKVGVDEPSSMLPTYSFKAHEDCVNGVSIHPNNTILATSSGQRHFKTKIDNDSENEESQSIKETTVKLWWIGDL